MPRPPKLINCPNAVSKKKSGIPQNTSVNPYGMRKAPVKEKKRNQDI